MEVVKQNPKTCSGEGLSIGIQRSIDGHFAVQGLGAKMATQ